LRKPGEVTHHIDLTELRKSFQVFAKEAGGNQIRSLYLLNIPSGQRISFSSFPSLLKDQKFILNESGIPYLAHSFTFFGRNLISSLLAISTMVS
jgi:hypothetical protein